MSDGASHTHRQPGALGGELAGRWVLDRYLLRRELARGSSGTVWLARERGARTRVSVRIVGPDGIERARQEAEALASLSHPHIPGFVTHGPVELDGAQVGWCVVTEHIDGVPLGKVLGVTSPRPPRAVQWARQLADALAHCHEHGLVHGAVGPGSVLVARDARGRERMVLVDFGGMRLAGSPAAPIVDRRLESVHGLAPEQIRGDAVDGRTDVYALGVLLYRMLVEHPPFERHTAEGVLRAHGNASPAPLGAHRPTLRLPPGLEDLVFRCLARDPEERFATAARVEEALAAVQYAPQRDWVRVTGLDLTLPPDDDSGEAGAEPMTTLRRPAVETAVYLGIVAVVLVVVAMVFLAR